MLCSILLPTRKRLPRLKRCIESIVNSSSGGHSFEILPRIHSDDSETLAAIPDLLTKAPMVRIVIGPPMRGYGDLSRFYDDVADIAHGEWVWVMNDDVTIEGKGWDTLLRQESKDAIVMPEIHKLGGSQYIRDTHNPFMFLPNRCWRQYGVDRFGSPFDESLWNLLGANGWPTRFLSGIGIWHDRDSDAELAKQRGDSLPLPKYFNDPSEHHMENL